MTTVNFEFSIENARQRIYINAIHAPITSNSLATNVSYVNFANGAGQIIYNDRPPVPESFTDPTPYQPYINQWITTEAALLTNPLTLAQAQAIKNGLIASIWSVKRQQPVNVTVGAGNFNWDASDQAVARMNVLAGFTYIDNVNTLITALDANVTDYNGLRSAYTTFVSTLQTNLNTWVSGLNTSESGITGWTSLGNMTVPSAGSTSAMSNPSSITVPTMKLLPYGGTSLVTVTPTDVGSILSAVATQNANESLVNATKQAAVNALSTIAAVASYDATTGW